MKALWKVREMLGCSLSLPHWGGGEDQHMRVDPTKTGFDSNNDPLGVKVDCCSPLSQHRRCDFPIKYCDYCSFWQRSRVPAAASGRG